MMKIKTRIQAYIRLMRLHQPVGIFLLLWPSLWGLWLAGTDQRILILFILGVVLTRSAGCIINDLWDQRFDQFVERTQHRPLVAGSVTRSEAFVLLIFLSVAAVSLVFFLNLTTKIVAIIAALMIVFYPAAKRVTDFPQVVLGITFGGMPVLMAFAAVKNAFPLEAWLLFGAASLWPMAYDTMYAMADSREDRKIGVRSLALKAGQYSIVVVAFLQILFLIFLIMLAWLLQFKIGYYVALLVASVLGIYQCLLLRAQDYLRAFRNNIWVGFVIFIGLMVG